MHEYGFISFYFKWQLHSHNLSRIIPNVWIYTFPSSTFSHLTSIQYTASFMCICDKQNLESGNI